MINLDFSQFIKFFFIFFVHRFLCCHENKSYICFLPHVVFHLTPSCFLWCETWGWKCELMGWHNAHRFFFFFFTTLHHPHLKFPETSASVALQHACLFCLVIFASVIQYGPVNESIVASLLADLPSHAKYWTVGLLLPQQGKRHWQWMVNPTVWPLSHGFYSKPWRLWHFSDI